MLNAYLEVFEKIVAEIRAKNFRPYPPLFDDQDGEGTEKVGEGQKVENYHLPKDHPSPHFSGSKLIALFLEQYF